MDPLSLTVEIFVATITGAIFGGTAMLVALDILADRKALTSKGTKASMPAATVQQIQPSAAQQASNSAAMPKAA